MHRNVIIHVYQRFIHYSRLLINKLLFEIEKLSGRSTTVRRKLIDNVTFQTTLQKDSEIISLKVTGDKLISSSRALDAIKGKFDGELPDLYPMKCTISMQKQHIYPENTFYRKLNAEYASN